MLSGASWPTQKRGPAGVGDFVKATPACTAPKLTPARPLPSVDQPPLLSPVAEGPVNLSSSSLPKIPKKNKITRLQKKSVTVTHSPITLANFSCINLVFIFRCSSSPCNPVYVRCVESSALVLVFHHTDTHLLVLSLPLLYRFIIKKVGNKQ